MTRHPAPWFTRSRIALLFAVILIAGVRYATVLTAAAEQSELERYQEALDTVRTLGARADGVLSDAAQGQLQDAGQRLSLALAYWNRAGEAADAVVTQARRDASAVVARFGRLLEASGEIERLWVRPGVQQKWNFARRWPSGKGVLLLRIRRENLHADTLPRFVRTDFDLARAAEGTLELGAADAAYAAVFIANAPTGDKRFLLKLSSAGANLGSVELSVTTPPTGTLNVTIIDGATGKPTPAAAAIYSSGNELIVPEEAMSFDDGGFNYTPGRVRPYNQAHYWPRSGEQARAFFVDAPFSVRVPDGSYKVIAGKGTEYLPVTETVTVRAGETASRQIVLRRWIDMPAKGWYSGDGHVHYTRTDTQANRRLMLWAQAEDVHMANVVRMGDARETYFEQYGFGKAGRASDGNYAIVPGQEDPRTRVIGHTLHLNIQRPVRVPERYYVYDLVFDEVHRQGGLTGYAHVYQPFASAFFVRRDMALNIPRRKVDFAEISEFGDIADEIYYEFLNLGFPLTASAGSDVPWGNTIGTSRVYAYTGAKFDPDAWFAALKAGHTFVTTGPMLELTVNGKIAGTEIAAQPGETLVIKAAAHGKPVPPRYLEVVAQGEVVKAAKAEGNQESVSVEFKLPVRGSTWIAARCAGAHTTPVYVKVGGRRFWKLDQVEGLIARRMAHLDEMEGLTRQPIAAGNRGGWDNPAALKDGAAELRERLNAARAIYTDLLRQAREERSRKEAN